ncbi:metalloprotease TldD [Gluconobacter oxydans]|uniref:TldD protein n=2 Tax=Gluconobacter oxydans TaxID=442 RepID=Q5FRX3_GLUOX|nr:metalloprotease TldD [Gluconobacter oxydans]AAW60873.1 TldD protein [Gluconobacter oxydans 621H]KXV31227.1 protease TldD [Gluconobacter oxydans]MBF0856001.1 metalloprotease TldD [Gluconobacter oxydans]TCW27521.1 TldD protein [Gluconobacter oxydans]GEC60517.1 peptidase C69 [Gluconobacter oxydans]
MSVAADALGALATTDALFFGRPDSKLTRDDARALVNQGLDGVDDGELFLEYRENESISLDDGTIRSASFNTSSGFGLRAVLGTETAFAHADDISRDALERAVSTVGAVRQGRSGIMAPGPQATNRRLYGDSRPLEGTDFAARAAVLSEIDAYARGLDSRVVQVSAVLSSEWQAVQIMRRADSGGDVADLRPLVRMNVSVVVEKDGQRESGSCGLGGRYELDRLLAPETWRDAVDKALKQALITLEAAPAPAGEMDVVLGPGWPGILLHEAVGHGLEGDFNRKGTSSFSGMIGKRVASPGVTVVDDGTLPERRGSLSVDDEGTPTSRTVLIEDGILTGYLQDRLNARLMGTKSTGNGRRESYAHAPMPRMTNTLMLEGSATTDEMIRSMKRGLYAVNFGGGQVDITSGKFVFAASEAYLVEDGKIIRPVKGATLIGNGADAMNQISMIGSDVALDPGIGTCGKAGQGVPVGVGQPTLKISGLTVGGTA